MEGAFLLSCKQPTLSLKEVSNVNTQFTDPGDQEVEIGMPVEMVTRKIRSDLDEQGSIVLGETPP